MSDDPRNHIGDMRHKPEAAAEYLADLLDAASTLALAADLPNSSAMLSACKKLVRQEAENVSRSS